MKKSKEDWHHQGAARVCDTEGGEAQGGPDHLQLSAQEKAQ